MTIVIDGDNITVNGKPVTEYKGDDLIIRRNGQDHYKIEQDDYKIEQDNYEDGA